MVLENPYNLVLLLALPVFIGLALMAYRQANHWYIQFAGRPKNPRPYRLQVLMLSLALAAMALALSEPKTRYLKTYLDRANVMIALGIDISKSMQAEDAALPEQGYYFFKVFNRLNRARLFAVSLLAKLRGELIGTFLFAGRGIELVPFTRDYAYCRYIFRHINDAELTEPGSDLAQALQTGLSMLQGADSSKARIMVLVSDGEDISSDDSDHLALARQAAAQGIKIFTVGVGAKNKALIPIRSPDGTVVRDYYQDEDGRHLHTQLQEHTLAQIAALTGGQFWRAGTSAVAGDVSQAILHAARKVEKVLSVAPAWRRLAPAILLVGLVAFGLGVAWER